jgi:hypothetical protein
MTIPGNLYTTAMAVMPHTDVDRALEQALSLDVPFWPQLPNYNYYEDMYVQASENFPGILLDMEKKTLKFSTEKFYKEYEQMLANADNSDYYDISETYSVVYHKFLEMDIKDRPAIRGQLEGPISFGFNVLDQDERPILFDDNIRPIMFEFMAKRINVQLARLKKINKNAFMFIDEPGLQFLWSAMAGYNDITAKTDLENFFNMIDRPRGIHLCGNPDWQFLLGLDMDIVSLDIYTNGEVFKTYAKPLKDFLDRGGVIAWGLVPTNFEPFEKEDMNTLEEKIEDIWDVLSKQGIDKDFLISRSLISPATCCLVNPDKEITVEKAFKSVKKLSEKLREKYLG